MIFCKECGEPLNLFATRDEEVCSACLRKRLALQHAAPPASTPAAGPGEIGPAGAVFSLEGEHLVLRSPEGWVLWSGVASDRHRLDRIVSRARKIDAIRRKRKT